MRVRHQEKATLHYLDARLLYCTAYEAQYSLTERWIMITLGRSLAPDQLYTIQPTSDGKRALTGLSLIRHADPPPREPGWSRVWKAERLTISRLRP